jgi:hypothetical protein
VIVVRLQLLHVPPHAAREIEHRPVDVAALIAEESDLLPRLVLVAVRVELEVLLAEPFLVPGHRRGGVYTR